MYTFIGKINFGVTYSVCMKSLKGTVGRYDLRHFPVGVWARINQKPMMQSILETAGVSDEGYRSLLLLMVAPEPGKPKCLGQVWASWFAEPRQGDIVVCLYHNPQLCPTHPFQHHHR